MENQGKSPKELLAELTKRNTGEYEMPKHFHEAAWGQWLLSSLSHLLRWSAEQMPQKKGAVCHECDGYDNAIDDCEATLLRLADEICR